MAPPTSVKIQPAPGRKARLPAGFKRWLAGPLRLPSDRPPPPGSREVEIMRHWSSSTEPRFARLRARLFPRRGYQPMNLEALLRGTGQQEIAEPIAWAIRTLSHWAGKRDRRVRLLPVARVISHAWQPARMARIFEKSLTGTRPPPVQLVLVRFKRRDFYLIEDGHHRCEVAKMRGETMIRGQVVAVMQFVPENWRIERGGFRCRSTGAFRKAAADLRAAARWLGVRASARR